jgi:glycosyltransferase involved in cell wall biosynthesis
MRILLLCPYPLGEAASQRFRFEQYFDALAQRGITVEAHPFLSHQAWAVLYQPGRWMAKALRIASGFGKRMRLMARAARYDMVFIHREAAPIGPPIFEWWLTRILQKKIIYDFDDAIWIPNSSESNRFFSFLKWYSNTARICRMAYKVSCGNEYLCAYAAHYNQNVVYNPTTIDTENLHNRVHVQGSGPVVIGWTGSHSTNRYLQEMVPILQDLESKYTFEFRVISDQSPELPLSSFRFVKWNKATEIDDLLAFSVGILPLPTDKWANGKCGFKALQYMALGVPALVSPVGVNTRIVTHGVNGYLCATSEEWKSALTQILEHPSRLSELAAHTRSKIEADYSVRSNTANFLSLFS